MKTRHLLPLVAACAAWFAMPAAATGGGLLPADPDLPKESPPFALTPEKAREQWSQKRLLHPLLEAYWQRVDAGQPERAAAFRELVLARLESHPHEVNDAMLDHGSTYSGLFLAIHANDVELVRLMLEKGAIPFLHEEKGWVRFGSQTGDLLLRIPGTKPEIIAMLREARSQYNVLEIMLQAQKHGVELRQSEPSRPRKH